MKEKKKVLKIGILIIPTWMPTVEGKEKQILDNYKQEMLNVLKKEVLPYLKEKNIKLQIKEICPDLKLKRSTRPEDGGYGGYNKGEAESLKSLVEKIKKEYKKYDQVLVLGGGHHAAWLLYHLPGKVACVDQHFDAYFSNISRAGYLGHILKNKIKKGSQIIAVSQEDKGDAFFAKKKIRLIPPLKLKEEDFEILDIDLDAFPKS